METNKQTTALQDIINWIDAIDNSVFALYAPENELKMLSKFKSKAAELLTKEKEQMIRHSFNFYFDHSHKMKTPENFILENLQHAINYFDDIYLPYPEKNNS